MNRLPSLFIALLLCLSSRATADTPDSQFFNANGVKIHFIRQGTGDPVVLIHGLYSSAVMNWQRPGIFSALAESNDVIALDLPGFGSSDKPEDPDAYGEQTVEDIALLLDHLKIRRTHIVGYSMGGMVALKFIAEHPDRVLTGVLGGMGWMPEGGDTQTFWEKTRSRPFMGAPEASVTSITKLAMTRDEVQGIKAPVEVLVGDRDPVKKLYVLPLEEVRPDWPVIDITGAGHITCIMKPQFTDELTKWLAAHRQG